MTSRETAFAALLRVEDGAYSNVLLPTMLRDSALDARDRAFATDLVYSTLRQQRALDYLVGLAADRPVGELDPPTRMALRLGAYQLTRDVPAHAAVQELIKIMRRQEDFPGARELYQEASDSAYAARQSSVAHSHPPPPVRGTPGDSKA